VFTIFREEVVMKMSSRVRAGTIVEPRELVTIHSKAIRIPDQRRLVHLQFRRFAGCPVCNLHLRSIVQRYKEIEASSVQEVVVFHSTPEALLPHAGEMPFAVIADPGKQLYDEFGVESGLRALLDPRAWIPILRGVLRSLRAVLHKQEAVPSMNPEGGRFGLPADFLIAPDGRVLASKYGAHAYDQWSVDEVLTLAGTAQRISDVRAKSMAMARSGVRVGGA
jgi:peroxiredoxin